MNIPCDKAFKSLYLACIAGITAFGLAGGHKSLPWDLRDSIPSLGHADARRVTIPGSEGSDGHVEE